MLRASLAEKACDVRWLRVGQGKSAGSRSKSRPVGAPRIAPSWTTFGEDTFADPDKGLRGTDSGSIKASLTALLCSSLSFLTNLSCLSLPPINRSRALTSHQHVYEGRFVSCALALLQVNAVSAASRRHHLPPGAWFVGEFSQAEIRVILSRLIRIIDMQNANSSLGAGGALEPYLVRFSSLRPGQDRLQRAAHRLLLINTRSMPATRLSSDSWGCSALALPFLPTG